MAIQRIYTDPTATPLVYYKILRVTSIIGALVNLGQLITLVEADVSTYDMCLALVSLALNIGCAIGLNMKKWGGVLCFHAGVLLPVLDSLVAIGIMIHYGFADASLLGQVVGQIIGAVIVFVPTYIYFVKRRLLFAPWPVDQKPTVQNTIVSPHTLQMDDTSRNKHLGASPQICFCRKCGYKLLPEDMFCGKCGVEVIKEG